MQRALVDLLSSIPTRPARQQLQLWRVQKEQRRRTSTLLHTPGRRVTAAQAMRLDVLDLSYPVLCEIRGSASSDDKFRRALQERGVRSKLLREKLVVIVKIGNG